MIDFEVRVLISSCTNVWRYDDRDFSREYFLGDEAKTIEFDRVDITNCPYTLTISDMTSGAAAAIDTSIFTFVEPVQVVDATNS